jgi:ketosteroid isomerase-like protein
VRRLLVSTVLGVLLVSLAACGGSDGTELTAEMQQKADYWEIDQIEKDFHEATTKKDIELMMSLWAPDATLTAGPGATAAGLDEIRHFWVDDSQAFQPETEWISDHPAYKLEITVNGDLGTLHFECHYIGLDTGRTASVTVADLDVARIDGQWKITNLVGGSTILTR